MEKINDFQMYDASIGTETYFYNCVPVYNKDGYVVDVIKRSADSSIIEYEPDKIFKN